MPETVRGILFRGDGARRVHHRRRRLDSLLLWRSPRDALPSTVQVTGARSFETWYLLPIHGVLQNKETVYVFFEPDVGANFAGSFDGVVSELCLKTRVYTPSWKDI